LKPEELLRRLHLDLGHHSATALSKIVLQEYDWESRGSDCQKIVQEYDSCESGEFQPAEPNAQLGAKRSDWKLLDEWSIGLLSDLPKTAKGNAQLTVCVEAVSIFVKNSTR
jgi:hypothetical protein